MPPGTSAFMLLLTCAVGVVLVIPQSVVLACQAGYALPTGETQVEFFCREGAWVAQNERLQSEDALASLACVPECSPSCLNGGECVAINQCHCHEPYMGPHCETLRAGLCWQEPPKVTNAVVVYNWSVAVIACQPGWRLSNNASAVLLSCVGGVWAARPDENWPSCQPECALPCANGGVCVSPDVCVCPDGFTGDFCEKAFCDPPPPVPFAFAHYSSEGDTYIACYPGYVLCSGLGMMRIECNNSIWLTMEAPPRKASELTCSPYCRAFCENGGSCVAPGECQCQEGFAGERCQTRKCRGLPDVGGDVDISLTKDSLSAVVECPDDYRLDTGSTSMNFKCVDGEWRPSDILMRVEKGLICRPECPKGCLNGGECVAPNTCHCPEGFTGSNCGKRYTLTVKGVPCRFPFLYKGLWRHGCTGQGNTRPWCATEVDPSGRIVSTGTCVADLGKKKIIKTERGQLCNFPFVHDNRKRWSCISTPKRPRFWCAVKADAKGHFTQWDFCQPDYGVEAVAFTQEGLECQLPFTVSGKDFYGCVEGGGRHPGNLWCATSVSTDGIIFASSVCMLHLGYKREIATKNGHLCQFPFVWKEQLYYRCVPSNDGNWCAVATSPEGRVLERDICIENLGTQGEVTQVVTQSNKDGADRYTEDAILPVMTKRGIPCVFPFRHNGRLHHSCVPGKDGQDGAWCATSVDASGKVLARESCPESWAHGIPRNGPTTSEVRTLSEVPCVFPFTLDGQVYYGCVTRHSGEAMCATQVDESNQAVTLGICPEGWDQDNGRTILADDDEGHESPEKTGVDGISPELRTLLRGGEHGRFGVRPEAVSTGAIRTVDGRACVFPFVWRGQRYWSCTNAESTKEWCATEVGHLGTPTAIGICQSDTESTPVAAQDLLNDGDSAEPMSRRELQPRPQTPDELMCTLPFMHSGAWHHECIVLAPDTPPVCAAKVAHDGTVLAWETCPPGIYRVLHKPVAFKASFLDQVPHSSRIVTTAEGQRCKFPFTYKGQQYSGCTDKDFSRPWCVTMGSSQGKNWGVCLAVFIVPKHLPEVIPTQQSTEA
ncbi:neurogenic locus notch homolog protein 1-like [Penaeus monodon]|uniref:neurogenic locus notch homolog protein 1-like n=1 Tax=Penaeus monodon TaxID=6687 RepID=UPI0018A6E750|nr:neurogenic locus notch homolog protein 1-like [Penaeus monodon]